MKRAPDPFPMFTATGVPEDFSAIDKSIAEAEARIGDQRLVGADLLIARLEQIDRVGRDSTGAGLTAEDIRFLAYTAIVFRVRRNLPLTENHLRLLAATLNVRRTPSGAAKYIGMPPAEDWDAFIAAADREAIEPDISENKLAKQVGVDRRTIREWRKTTAFAARKLATRQRENPGDADLEHQRLWDAVAAETNKLI